ncbi:Poly-beta-1,6-N-acetyl-D-glucosamine N-deacetylase precursor [compost metagenome]
MKRAVLVSMTTSNWRLTLIVGGILFALVLIWVLATPTHRPTQIAADSGGQIPLLTHPPVIKELPEQTPPIEITIEPSIQQMLPIDITTLATETISLSTTTPVPISTSVPIPSPVPTPTSTTVSSVTVNDSVYKTASIRIPILNYHSVTVQPGNPAAITPAKLEEQMQYLADNDYTPLTLKEFIDIWEGREKPPAKPILLTFDDGYKDNYTEAMPILAKHDFRATLFMSPGMVEDGYFLNWEEVKEMQKGGWDIQPHGMTHPHLPQLNKEKQTYEITEAKRQIEEQLGITSDIYCYPYGERNQTTLSILKEHGFRYAFTIDQGKATSDQHPFLIRRLFVNGEAGMNSFKALLK